MIGILYIKYTMSTSSPAPGVLYIGGKRNLASRIIQHRSQAVPGFTRTTMSISSSTSSLTRTKNRNGQGEAAQGLAERKENRADPSAESGV